MDEHDGRERVSRRQFLLAGAAATLAACSSGGSEPTGASSAPRSTSTSSPPTSSTTTSPTTTSTTATDAPASTAPAYDGPDPFRLGVASGDPEPDSVVLWTMLDTGSDVRGSTEDLEVTWDVATDGDFADIVASDTAAAPASFGHSVHAIADGLPPDSWFYYRFRIGEYISSTGRTRTAPVADSSVDELRIGVSSCQNWELGGYAAHRHLAAAELDLFVFLGDYIYEYGPNDGGVITASGPRVHANAEPIDLDGYRRRYAEYRSDPDLQAHHGAHPWAAVWDDHEVDNNYAGLEAEDEQTAEEFAARRRAAYQAWWEFMPVRSGPPTDGGLRIHRSIRWGRLADLHLLDGRQYRDPQPTDGEAVDVAGLGDLGARTLGPTALDPDHSMLGADQESWLLGQLGGSTARWNLLGNQVMMHGINAVPGPVPTTPTDTWDGYHANRERLLDGVVDSGVENLVVLTGDFHSSSIADIRADPFDLDRPVIASELMAPAISSAFPETLRSIAPLALLINPQVRYFEPDNGYMTCTIRDDEFIAEVHVLDDVTDEASAVEVKARALIRAGTPGISAVDVLDA